MSTPARSSPISATLLVSIAIHLVALGLLVQIRLWPLSLALIAMNHAVLIIAGLWPRSTLLGLNHRRLSASAVAAGHVALTIDDGPDPLVTPRVLKVLDQYNCKATFFCIGERVAAHPDIARDIVRRGHLIENHTQRHHLSFSLMGPRRMRNEIRQAQAEIAAVAGQRPRYFRAPAGLRNVLLDRVLRAEGLQLVSWTRRGFDTVTSSPELVVARLTRGLRSGDILLVHDGHAARGADGTAVILSVLPSLLTTVARAGLTCVTLQDSLQ